MVNMYIYPLNDNELFNFNNYLKLERRQWKVEINLGSWIVKYLHLKQIKSNMLNSNEVH